MKKQFITKLGTVIIRISDDDELQILTNETGRWVPRISIPYDTPEDMKADFDTIVGKVMCFERLGITLTVFGEVEI